MKLRIVSTRKPLRLGFLPVSDCAPLVVAHEFGIYEKYGLKVQLQRELSWKGIHDKIVSGQLDAAHAPGTLPILARLGLTSEPCHCVAGMVLNLQGNSITLSNELAQRGVHNAATLREVIRGDAGRRTYTFGVVLPFSSQYFLLCQWLRSAGINPYTEVRILTASPAEMFPLLNLGYLDGYCAGEPWTSVAVEAGVGHCVSTSVLLAPLHPEKVLMVRETFARKRAEEHEHLLAALLEACEICEEPDLRSILCDMLAGPHYVDAPVECLRPGLLGPFGLKASRIFALHGLNIFHRHNANDPTPSRVNWLFSHFREYFRWRTRPAGLDTIFRRDIFERAQQLREKVRCRSLPAAAGPVRAGTRVRG